MAFINGRNPDLIVLDDEHREKKRFDLTAYANVDEIHNLLMSEGFEVKKMGDIADAHPQCAEWAQSGECTKNPDYMMSNCKLSCSTIRTELRS